VLIGLYVPGASSDASFSSVCIIS